MILYLKFQRVEFEIQELTRSSPHFFTLKCTLSTLDKKCVFVLLKMMNMMNQDSLGLDILRLETRHLTKDNTRIYKRKPNKYGKFDLSIYYFLHVCIICT